MVTATTLAAARAVVAAVPDPELPVVTIEDLGVLRDVRVDDRGRVVVEITPTYSGCPAMDAIRDDVLARLRERGHDDAEVRLVLAPAWTTHGGAPPCANTASHPRTGPGRWRSRCRCGAPAADRRTPARSAGSARRHASRCGPAAPASSRSTT